MADRERSEEYQRQFISAVARAANSTDSERAFGRAVEARLTKGAEEYGEDAWTPENTTAEKLLAEVLEEGVDLAAWSCLALQHISRLERDGRIERDAAANAAHLLVVASAKAMEAWVAVAHSHSIVEQYGDNPQRLGRPPKAFSDQDL